MTTSPPRFTNVAAYLSWMADRVPDRPAVHYPAGGKKNGRIRYRSISFYDLDRDSNRAADGLIRAGIAPGTRAVLMVRPGRAFFTLTFALFKAGIIPVLVDPGMGIKHLKTCLPEAAPGAFIGIPRAQLARMVLGWGKATIRNVVTVGSFPGFPGMSYRKIMAMGDDRPFFDASILEGHNDATDPASIASINFTSGSTGPPKGAVYTHGIFAAQVTAIRDGFGIEQGEIDLCTFPLFALFAPALGMTAVVPAMDATRPADVDPRAIIQAMNDFAPTNMFGSPALLTTVGRYCHKRGIRFPSLRRVISAGAPVRPDILRLFTPALTEGAQVFSGYGATEAMPLAMIGSDEILRETAALTADGNGVCVGRPLPGMDLRIMRISDEPVDEWTNDLEVEPGDIGEIVARGPVVTREYFRRPRANALAKMTDPESKSIRHRMGDLGRFDESGRLWFCGRKAHRVSTSGRTWFPVCCEGVFNVHPAVFRTALVGVSPGGVMTPVICVERKKKRSGNDDRKLAAALRSMADANPVTRGITHFLFHDGFPVDIRHNSKIFREKLAVWAEKKLL